MPTDVFDLAVGVAWHPSYSRERVEQFLAEAEAARARLLAEIATADQRVVSAASAVGAAGVEGLTRLGRMVVGATRPGPSLSRARWGRGEDHH